MKTIKEIISASASFDEALIRKQGIGFMVGSVPGYALFLGGKPSQVSSLLAEITHRKILVFVCDQSLSYALEQAGSRLDWDSGVVSLDFDHALGFIWRVAQVFGNLEVEQDVIPYVQRRLKGFSLLLGDADEEKMEKAQLAMQLGCPFLSTGSIPPMADMISSNSRSISVGCRSRYQCLKYQLIMMPHFLDKPCVILRMGFV